jgi:hypothetical protein
MTTGLSVIRGTTVYNLNDVENYLWISDDGLGMAPLHRLAERGPQQHGDSDVGFRLDPRTIKMVIGLFGTDDSSYWTARDTLLRIFKPSNDPIGLLFTLPNGGLRQIDVHIAGEMDYGSGERDRIAHRVGLVLRADNPTFYDPTGQSVRFNVGLPTSSGFTVPMPVPMPVGAFTTALDQTKTIAYTGSWLELPLVRIVGPVTNPKVENLTTDEKLDFTGTTISAGDYYEINCGYGIKTVVDSTGTNRIDKLTSDSDLNTFHLGPDPDVPGGNNDIRVTGTSISTATEIYVQHNTRYVGI